MAPPKDTRSINERFDLSFIPEPNSGCWIWMRGISSTGYGAFCIDGKTYGAHRISYELYKGAIPIRKQLDHLCRVRSCVNPDHLEIVTRKENLRRGESFSGLNYKKTHCIHGHKFSRENTIFYTKKNGGISRLCRKCRAWQYLNVEKLVRANKRRAQ